MPGPVNKIGPYAFITLRGQPDALKQRLEIVMRRGVNGVGLFRTGIRGEPFSLESAVDAASKAAARTYFRNYKQLIGADPVDLIWSDLELETGGGFQVAVLDVVPLDIRTLASSSGGLNPPSLGWIEARWKLIPIAS